ncbi:hypothetical protein M9H77_07018 [Catharanthus roseus]|uniref:Uncharacterized protein n=1 Tax=Catharanthus roseus TaxID=4058 RepID=A0ACC0BTZ8_CATRO|nr:hypothetical protein M9H77_07018 [Catharanthus roseus]
MFQIGPQKAPRPDGQIPILFQKYWEFMQGPVWRFVQMSLEKRSFPKDLNQSKSWRPHEVGGLGVTWLRLLNEAYMAKLGWKLMHSNALWSKLMRGKYRDLGQHLQGSQVKVASHIFGNVRKDFLFYPQIGKVKKLKIYCMDHSLVQGRRRSKIMMEIWIMAHMENALKTKLEVLEKSIPTVDGSPGPTIAIASGRKRFGSQYPIASGRVWEGNDLCNI